MYSEGFEHRVQAFREIRHHVRRSSCSPPAGVVGAGEGGNRMFHHVRLMNKDKPLTPPSMFDRPPKSRERKATSREGEDDSDGGSTGDCPPGMGEAGEA